jgi:hypothetical protein
MGPLRLALRTGKKVPLKAQVPPQYFRLLPGPCAVPSQVESDVGRRTRTYTRTFTVQLESGTALSRSGLRNWSECTSTFVCAVSEVIRNMKTCSCLQWRLIRSTKQRMTSLWKTIQISKLKAGSQCAGHCPSVALLRRARGFHCQWHLTRRVRVTVCQIFHPLRVGGWDTAQGLSGRSHGARLPVPSPGSAPAPHTQAGCQGLRLSGTMMVRD